MKLKIRPFVAVLLSALCGIAKAEEPEVIFDRKLAGGFEPAALLENSTAPDGSLSVLFTARKKGLKPANWPSIIPGVPITSTDVLGSDDYTTENWIVSIPEKKRLGVVRSTSDDFKAWHQGQNLRYFYALWGPGQEGWHYGLLSYSNRWGCTDVFLVNCDGTEAKMSSIRGVLDAAARKAIVAQRKKADGMQIGFEPLDVVNPNTSVVVTDSLTMRVVFVAQIPKSEVDAIEGTMTVKFSRNEKGAASATVLGVKAGRANSAPLVSASAVTAPARTTTPARTTSAPSAKSFAAFRNEWDEKAKTDVWKSVRKNLPSGEKGRSIYVKGWVGGTVLRRLIHVDGQNDKNKAITIYYWREGQLTSVFRLKLGEYTEISEVGETTDTFNFVDEKLVGWFSTGERNIEADPNDPYVQDTGRKVLEESVKLAEPIYQAIGAD